jgi:general secretion pathway protein F
MPVFEYKGIHTTGKNVKGVQEADSVKILQAILRRDGIFLTDVFEVGKRPKTKEIKLASLFQRITAMEVVVMTRQLATLLSAGVPLVQGIAAVIDQIENPDFKRVLTQIREKINEGLSFAEALEFHKKIFPPLYINMVNAGEQSGTLEIVLSRLAEFSESQLRLRNKVLTAMAYPAFMAVMGIVIVGIMMVVVVPKITTIFEDFSRTLPWYTRMLIFTSDTLSSGVFWLFAFPLILGLILGFSYLRKSPKGRMIIDRFILKLPLFGNLSLMLAVSRFSKTLSTLLRSGVPLLRSLEITKRVLGNKVLSQVIEDASLSIKEGETIADPIKKSGKFPPIVTHMIAIGERSGELETMLESIAQSYDNQIETRLNTMTSLLEPLMILIMGGMAGFITFSILMPLLELNQFVGTQ